MDKLKKALSGDDDDEESGIVTQVKRKSYLWMLLSFIYFAEIEMIVNDVSCGLKIEQTTCTDSINLMNII